MFYSETSIFRKSPIDGGKPYSVWKSPVLEWYCVLDRNGNNISGTGQGYVCTSKENAESLCKQWNEQ